MGVLLGKPGASGKRGGVIHFIPLARLSGAGPKTKTVFFIKAHRVASGKEVKMCLFSSMELILPNRRNFRGEEGDRNKINLGMGTC